MTSTTDYKGLLILDPSVGTGGDMINDDMKEIADRAGPVFSEAFDPTANDDGADTGGNGKAYQWSKWLNSSTGQLFLCTDNTTGAAVWKRIDADGSGISDIVEDTTPQLGGNLDLNGKNVNDITPTEIGYLDGVTSNIQSQIDAAASTGGIDNLVEDTTPQLGGDLDANGHKVAGVTPTEMGYLVGITSGVQSQLDGKAASSHNHAAADINSGTLGDARVAESNVTQHEAAIDHDALTNFNADEHVDHTAIDIIAGTGLSGGGDLTSTRTLNIDNPAGVVQGTDGTYDIRATNEGTVAGNARGENSVDLQTIRGTATQVASGNRSVIGGGTKNTASGDYSTVGGGLDNNSSGTGSFIGGGWDNRASGNYTSIVGGQRALADKYGQQAHANGRFTSRGDAQGSQFILRKEVTHSSNAWHELHLTGSSGQLILATDTAWTFDALIVGATAGMGKTFNFRITGGIKNDGGTTSITASSVTTIDDADDTSFGVRVTADDTNDALKIEVSDSDGSSDTVRWVCKLSTVELTFA